MANHLGPSGLIVLDIGLHLDILTPIVNLRQKYDSIKTTIYTVENDS